MGQYNPNAPLAVGNEYAPVLYSPYTPELFVERGWSFRASPGFDLQQANLFFDSVPAWSVPGHAYVVTVYRRGQETSTGPLKTVTIPLVFDNSTNVGTGGGAPTTSQALVNPSDGWYIRFRVTSAGEAYIRLRTGTIPPELSEPGLSQGKRIHDVSILYTATAEVGNETPVPLQINHYYDVTSERVPYGTATVDLVESLTTNIQRSRWGEICTWFRIPALVNPFTSDTSRATWNYDLLTLFSTGSDFLVEFRTENAAQDGPREVNLNYAAMQITYSEENRVANWGVVLGSDYNLTGDDGTAGGHRLGRNTQGPGNGYGFAYPNAVELASGGASSGGGGGVDGINVFDGTITVKRADYGSYNNQGPAGKLRALRTVDVFPGHPGIVINNTLEPGKTPTSEVSDLLPQIVIQAEGTGGLGDIDPEAAPLEFGHTYGLQAPLLVHADSTAVQEILPAANGPDTPYTKVRFWARSHGAQSSLRLVVETADQGPVTVAVLEPADLESYPEIADGWRQVDLEVDPAFLIDDYSVASGTEPEVQATVHQASGVTTAAWSVAAPAGTLEGRLLLLLHGADTSDIADMGTPSGGAAWTLLRQTENFNSGQGAARLWWKIGGAAEPASYGLTQLGTSDGVAIVTAVQNVDSSGLRSSEIFADPVSTSTAVSTPDVPIDGPGGIDLRFAVGLFNNATWTPPTGWTLLAGSVPTRAVSAGLGARTVDASGGIQSMTSSVTNALGRFGVTVTLPGSVVGPAAPRWESDTSLIRPWEILAARVVDPNLPDDVFSPANPARMGIGTYGGALAEGGIEGDLPATADIDVSVVWGQAMPTIEGLTVESAVQALQVVDSDCPIPPACIADGLYYLAVTWTPIDSGVEFVDLGNYELQRQDATMGMDEWEVVATPIHPLVDRFDDYEARVGVETYYRIRYVHKNGMAGDWSATVTAEVPAPGVTGVSQSKGVLIFTSNEDPARNLAYVQVWTGAASEDFDFVEAATLDLQRMYGRDYQVAFRPMERGGVAFTRNLLVNAVQIPVETLRRGFVSLRDLAWADLPYVAVRSDRGDRWLANINVPTGTIRDRRRLYMAEIRITEVSDQPFALSSTYCEGLTARGALPSTIFEPRFATTPDEGQFDNADISLRVEMRLDQTEQRIPLQARFVQQTGLGWFFNWMEDATLWFFIQDGVGADSSYTSAEVPFGAGDLFWVRLDYDPDGGGATSTAQFYTSPDGVVWTPLTTTMATNQPVPGNDPTFVDIPLTVGASADGTVNIPLFETVGGAGGWNGTILQAQYLGDGGAVLADPNFVMQDMDAVQFTDSVGNRWSVAGGICTVDRRL